MGCHGAARLAMTKVSPALKPPGERVCALVGLLFGSVEPVGQSEQAKDHKHDDQDVMGLHGASFARVSAWMNQR
jgi:hypothetical protein